MTSTSFLWPSTNYLVSLFTDVLQIKTSACMFKMPAGGAAFDAVDRDAKLLLNASIDSPLIPLSASRLSVTLSQ